MKKNKIAASVKCQIKQIMLEKDITQFALAQKAGLKFDTVKNFFKSGSNCSVKTFYSILEALDTQIVVLDT